MAVYCQEIFLGILSLLNRKACDGLMRRRGPGDGGSGSRNRAQSASHGPEDLLNRPDALVCPFVEIPGERGFEILFVASLVFPLEYQPLL
jgi:hypothetical protein